MEAAVAYQGAKVRLAAQIADLVGPVPKLVDACCGSGAVAIEFVRRGLDPSQVWMYDAGPWGSFWQAIGGGYFPLSKLRALVERAPTDPRALPPYVKGLAESTEHARCPAVFVLAQAASFGSKPVMERADGTLYTTYRTYWEPTATSSRRSPVNPLMPMPGTLVQRVAVLVERMRGANAQRRDVSSEIFPADAVVYCDPPYVGTAGYGTSLDPDNFFQRVRRTHRTYMSEARPLSGDAVLLDKGRSKGGISGQRKEANAEWLSAGGPSGWYLRPPVPVRMLLCTEVARVASGR